MVVGFVTNQNLATWRFQKCLRRVLWRRAAQRHCFLRFTRRGIGGSPSAGATSRQFVLQALHPPQEFTNYEIPLIQLPSGLIDLRAIRSQWGKLQNRRYATIQFPLFTNDKI
jgi:hypothetical protein